MLTDRERWILLNGVQGIRPLHQHRLLDAFGTLERLFAAPAEALSRVDKIGRVIPVRVASQRGNTVWLARELATARRLGVTLLTLADAGYPELLRHIPDAPPVLYIRGRLPAKALAVAIVGSRPASLYGLQTAQRLGHDLGERGVTVVSGLAKGIDAAAHQGCLRAGGTTIAVLGSALDRLYPEEHATLAEQIVEAGGAIISEHSFGTGPWGHFFPQRNRIISGLSLGVVVVEAALRSGALITAHAALEQAREVFAVPGPVTASTSQGTHALLKQGARLVASAEDVFEELGLAAAAPPEGGATPFAAIELPDAEERVFACVSARARDVDTITQASGMDASQVSSALLHLELKRLVQQLPGKQFRRATGPMC